MSTSGDKEVVDNSTEKPTSPYEKPTHYPVKGGRLKRPKSYIVFAWVSIVIRMIPSPDWFVGVDSLDLCEGDQWKDKVTIQLNPIDAGVDKGLTFTSPDWPSKEKISEITSKSPSHPASPFYYPKLNKLPRIGTLTFEKAPIDISDVDNLSDLLDDNDYVEEEGTSTPIDCEVADWGKWGPCQGKCKTGRKIRYRVVVQPAMNGGAECPTLSDEA
ncbi:spondin-2-like [Lingula anatina]|uniref:Spondin-2-like n=1 Tax=Lingula anatina TaxID=7574 RepID=A0A1S3H8T7_LINAN|nr:spondin-2-like [Lingula anatina]|eukprot:XP_013381891.1 spondin-2-like [Lingula anatina]